MVVPANGQPVGRLSTITPNNEHFDSRVDLQNRSIYHSIDFYLIDTHETLFLSRREASPAKLAIASKPSVASQREALGKWSQSGAGLFVTPGSCAAYTMSLCIGFHSFRQFWH